MNVGVEAGGYSEHVDISATGFQLLLQVFKKTDSCSGTDIDHVYRLVVPENRFGAVAVMQVQIYYEGSGNCLIFQKSREGYSDIVEKTKAPIAISTCMMPLPIFSLSWAQTVLPKMRTS